MSKLDPLHVSHESLPADLADVAGIDAMLQHEALANRAAMPQDLAARIATASEPMLTQEIAGRIHAGTDRQPAQATGSSGSLRHASRLRHVRPALLALAACVVLSLIVVPLLRTQPSQPAIATGPTGADPVADIDLLIAAVDAMDRQTAVPSLTGESDLFPSGLSDEDLLPLIEVGGSL